MLDGRAPLLLFAALVGGTCVAAGAQNKEPAIAAFDRTFASVNDYTCVLHVRETMGTQTQDRVYEYAFMRPHDVQTLILDGQGKGSGAVWVGGDQVSGHLGGIFAGIHVKIDVHDRRVVSLRGVTIPEGLLPGVIDDYETIPGTLTETSGGKIGGVDTDRLQLMVADPAANHDISEQILYLSAATHWPIRQIMYSGSEIVLDESVSDIRTNVGLVQSDFPF